MGKYLSEELLYLDPTIKQAHINLGHFKTEQLQRRTHSYRSMKDTGNSNKKRKSDFMFTYERLCRGESRKVGDLTCLEETSSMLCYQLRSHHQCCRSVKKQADAMLLLFSATGN